MCGCLLPTPYWGPDLAHNPVMCLDWELNWRPFGLQAGTQSTEPNQPEHTGPFLFALRSMSCTCSAVLYITERLTPCMSVSMEADSPASNDSIPS